MYQKLEKMKEAHEFRIAKLKLQGELSIEENRIKNEIALNKLNSEKEQLNVINSIRQLKTLVKQDKSIIKSGNFLIFWGTLGTIISTLLTISGLWNFFNTSYLKTVSFILSIVMTQFTVFILAKQDTNVKRHFRQHALKVSMLKTVLLSISIYGNYTFFTSGREINILGIITTLALCMAIDIISIYCISIAQDFKTLNKNVSTDSLYKGLFGKILYNMTYSFVNGIETKYQNNKNSSIFVYDKQADNNNTKKLENKGVKQIDSNFVYDKQTEENIINKAITENKNSSVFVSDKDIEDIKNAILNYRDGNISPSISALMELTGLSKEKVIESKKILEKRGLIKTKDRKTYIQNIDVLEKGVIG